MTGRTDSRGRDDAYWGWLDETGRLRLSVGDGAGITSPDPVNDGNLHHYVLVRDAVNGRLAMYRNGVKIAEGTGAAGKKDGSGSYDRLGAIEGGTASLNGGLEDVQVFDHVLTAHRVSLLYGTGIEQATLDASGTVGVAASFEAKAQGDATTTYQWDFGDGSSSAASTSRTTSHTYTRPGHYTVLLTVTTGGRVRRYNFIKTVTYLRTNVPPTASSTIVGSGNLVFRANPDSATVTAIHAASLSKDWERHVGRHPRTVAVDALGRLWVAVQGEDRLECLDTAANSCGTIETGRGSAPYGIAFVPGTSTGLVTLEGSGEVLRFDASTATVLARKAVNAEPRGIAIAADGAHAYVTRLRSTTAGLVTKIDAGTLSRVSDIALDVDSTTVDAQSRARGKPNYLTQVVVSPDGRVAWVPSKQDNTLRGPSRDGQALTHDSTVRAITSIFDLVSGRELSARRIDFDDRSGAVAVAFSPLGDYAFVAQQGSNEVAIVDAYTGAVKGALTGGAGLAPDGIWIDETRRRAFVSNFTTRSVSVYDVAEALDSISFEPGLEREISAVSVEQLARAELRGLRIFYNAADPRMSLDGYISCASCHLGGGDDGTVWDFSDRGEGLRNTIALDGREGTAMGRVHWTANFDEIQDFENDIRNAFGGSGFMTQADFRATSDPLGSPKAGRSRDLDDLDAYVASLDDFGWSPHRMASGELTDAATEGRNLFFELNCQSCHSGSTFTDEQRHDVGTIVASSGEGSGQALAGVGFKTPTLLGAWRTAPYFHSGSAATLADVVGSRHGGERAVTRAERDKLVAYLLSLESPRAARATLTAQITDLPASHDGRTAFSFTLSFSTDVRLSYLDFSLGALELTGAAVKTARRLSPRRSQNWEITLQPGWNEPVVIVLRAGRGCSEQGAICTRAWKPLSERLAVSVPGPVSPTAPVATVSAQSSVVAEGAAAAFAVKLDAVPVSALSVGIAVTQTGSVLRGAAPTSVSFEIGEMRRTLLLGTDDDAVDEADGTVTVALSAGAGYTLGSPVTAAVTVNDNDGTTALAISSALSYTVQEGDTAVGTLSATEAADLVWSIPAGAAGGADGDKFTITSAGALAFAWAMDFENPDDADTDGSYQVVVQASDGAASGRAGLTVTLTNRNEAPTAEAGADQADIKAGATVTLGGAGSDPDAGDELTYAWTQAGGPEVVLSDAAIAAPTFMAPTGLIADATLTFTLRVIDRAGLHHNDVVAVAVKVPVVPVATIAEGTTPVTEGTAASFTVTLDQAPPEALAVAVSVAESGSALSGTAPASVAFAKGATSATLSVPTSGDSVVEAESTVTATVTAGTGYLVGTGASASVRVEDDDAATFTVSAAPEVIAQGESATLTVAISNGVTFAEDQPIELALSGTASAADYTMTPAALTLAAGASSVTAELTASADLEEEEAETVTVTASHGGVLIGSATVTIQSGPVSRDATLSSLSLSGIDIGTFSSEKTLYEVSVAHAVESTTVTATASHPGATVAFDPRAEVRLGIGTNEIGVTVTAEDGRTTGLYIVAVTRPEPSLTATFVDVPERHGGSGSFPLRILFSEPIPLSDSALRDLSLRVTNGDVLRAERVSGRDDLRQIVIAPSSDAAVTIVLPATADCAAPAAVCTADDSPLSNRLEAVVPGPSRPEVSITALSSPVTEGTVAAFSVTLDEAASAALTVSVSVTESGSMLAGSLPESMTFAADETSATLSVPAEADTVVEADSTVTATVTSGPGYTVGTASSASVTVEDDDTATFTVSAAPEAIAEGESATLTVAISNGVTFSEAQTVSLATSGTAAASELHRRARHADAGSRGILGYGHARGHDGPGGGGSRNCHRDRLPRRFRGRLGNGNDHVGLARRDAGHSEPVRHRLQGVLGGGDIVRGERRACRRNDHGDGDGKPSGGVGVDHAGPPSEPDGRRERDRGDGHGRGRGDDADLHGDGHAGGIASHGESCGRNTVLAHRFGLGFVTDPFQRADRNQRSDTSGRDLRGHERERERRPARGRSQRPVGNRLRALLQRGHARGVARNDRLPGCRCGLHAGWQAAADPPGGAGVWPVEAGGVDHGAEESRDRRHGGGVPGHPRQRGVGGADRARERDGERLDAGGLASSVRDDCRGRHHRITKRAHRGGQRSGSRQRGHGVRDCRHRLHRRLGGLGLGDRGGRRRGSVHSVCGAVIDCRGRERNSDSGHLQRGDVRRRPADRARPGGHGVRH